MGASQPAGAPTQVGKATAAKAGKASAPSDNQKAAAGDRLRPGELRSLIHTFLAERPGQELTPTKIGKELGRSAGAVGNALATMTDAGQRQAPQVHGRSQGQRGRRGPAQQHRRARDRHGELSGRSGPHRARRRFRGRAQQRRPGSGRRAAPARDPAPRAGQLAQVRVCRDGGAGWGHRTAPLSPRLIVMAAEPEPVYGPWVLLTVSHQWSHRSMLRRLRSIAMSAAALARQSEMISSSSPREVADRRSGRRCGCRAWPGRPRARCRPLGHGPARWGRGRRGSRLGFGRRRRAGARRGRR
jgi:hypothetical protein